MKLDRIPESVKDPVFWLKIAAFSVLAGRCWQHLFWDAPYRTLLWDPYIMRPIVENLFKLNWNEWLVDLRVDSFVQYSKVIVGIFLGVCAFVSLLARPGKKLPVIFLFIASAYLMVLSVLFFKDNFYRGGHLIEYSAQIASPLLLGLWCLRGRRTGVIEILFITSIAFTFVGHGLYAVGFYPIPGKFVQMIIEALPVSEDQAVKILLVAGSVDFAAAIFLLIPQTRKAALIYMILWGFLTAFARLYSNYFPENLSGFLHRWVHEFVYRIPHFTLPLAYLLKLGKDAE